MDKIKNISRSSHKVNSDIDVYLEKLNKSGVVIELYETFSDYIRIYQDKTLPRVKVKLKKYFNILEVYEIGGISCAYDDSIDIAKALRVYQISLK